MPADTLSLAGKVAIVTGSGRENGIGAGIARALARNGASVTVHHVSDSSAARTETTARKIREDFGVPVVLVRADVSTPAGASHIVSETLTALGADHIDILVNNAGAARFGPLLDVTPEILQATFAVNMFGPLYMSQAVVRLGKMPPGGRIINIGSGASKLGPMNIASYAASKAAADSLTASLAGELGQSHGITVNMLGVGPVPTDIVDGLSRDAGRTIDLESKYAHATRAAKRVGTVEDIADAVLLLVSERSRWITAQYIGVSGGLTGTM